MVPLLVHLCLLCPTAAAAPGPWTEAPPVSWGATSADWRLVIREGEPVRVEADYALQSVAPAAAVLTLAGPELLVTQVSGPVFAAEAGLGLALGPDRRKVQQHFAGLYTPEADGALSLGVLPALRTHVTVDAPGLDVTIEGAVNGWLPPVDRLQVRWRPHVDGEVPYEALVTQGEAAATFRGDGGGLLVDAVVRWRVVRGEARRLTFAASGLDELEVSGEGVRSWRREGDSVVIEPKAPVKGLFVVVVKGRAPLGKSKRSVPVPEPTGVLRVDRYVTMARADEGELIPVSMPESVPLARLPGWAKNLGDGVPLVAWHGPQPVAVLPGSFETIQGPDTVITQARYTLAAAAEGHAALRMNLRVRNERRQYLHLRPQKGWVPLVIRVGNQPVSWLSDGEGGIYVPLEKSVETVKGLLSFPVDVEWLGSDTPVWEKRGEMALILPSVDAPVQAATWEVHLPRGYRALRRPESTKRGMVLSDLQTGSSVDSSVAEEDRKRQEVVSSALQNAVSAYKQNDWSTAQTWLDQAKSVDANNEDAQGLQANLDVLEGRSAANDLGSRRVKELAKAKTSGLQEAQKATEKEAEYALRSGDLDAAERGYAAAAALASTLQKTEQFESAEQSTKLSDARRKLDEIQSQRRDQAEVFAMNGVKGDEDEEGTYGGIEMAPLQGLYGAAAPNESDADGVTDILDFEGLDIDGELAQPMEGAGMGGLGVSGTGMGGGGNGEDVSGGFASTESVVAMGDGWSDDDGRGSKAEEDVDAPGARTGPQVVLGRPAPVVATTPAPMATAGKGKAAPKPPPPAKKSAPAPRSTRAAGASAAPAAADPTPGLLALGYAAPPPPPPPAPPPTTVDTERTASGVTLTKDHLEYIPAGRSYQSTIGGEVEKKPAAKEKLKREETRANKAAKIDMEEEVDLPAMEAPAPEPEAAPEAPEAAPEDGEFAAEGQPTPTTRGPRVPERRAALVATPSPMALAMPLDGPTVLTTQALQPADTFPTFTFRYQSLPSENR